MRPPFKTDQELSDQLASLSEAIRFDYCRRVEQASVAALAAHFERDLADRIKSQASTTKTQVTRVNLTACTLLVTLAAATLIADLPYVRVVAWFFAGAWVAYLGAAELFILPQLRLQQAKHWNGYQKHAREWTMLLGNQGFAEHLAITGAEFRGEAPDDADTVHRAIRGFALAQALQAARR